MARRMSKAQKEAVLKGVKKARQEYYDQHKDEAAVPHRRALDRVEEAYKKHKPNRNHPDITAALRELDEANRVWEAWHDENYPESLKKNKLKFFGGRKNNLRKRKLATVVVDAQAVATAKAHALAVRANDGEYGEWLSVGALVCHRSGKLVLVSSFDGYNPNWCQVVVDGSPRTVEKKSLRPID